MFSFADFVTALGWFGAVAGAAAYLLVSRGRWSASSARYQTANLLGAGLMGGVAAFNQVWPSAAANMVWVVIGGQALWMIGVKKRSAREEADRAAAEATLAALPATPAQVLTDPIPLVVAPSPEPVSARSYEELLEERDPTLRMSTADLAALTGRGVAAAA
ncbi:CBU_0592 family membrane protein [Mumia zhuanghuii]|uniref:CBU_0592 family membrane protein n=1 Tax=Mumia zhuanghuii TaxID=2585211 RepID=UPI001890D077|nr:hypothetical protein [Mumia zhuanghuii]